MNPTPKSRIALLAEINNSPLFGDEAEERMHQMEAEGDRQQTIREETAKAEYKRSVENGATAKQIDLIVKLGKELREAAGDSEPRNGIVTIFAKSVQAGLTVARASEAITAMIDLKKVWREDDRHQPQSEEPEAGMYRLGDGMIVRVYLGQQSGKMLAKRLVSDGDHHEYEYMGRAARFVSSETAKLTLEEAKEFGRMTGTCCVCARRLDVPESVEAGIGPVCSSRIG